MADVDAAVEAPSEAFPAWRDTDPVIRIVATIYRDGGHADIGEAALVERVSLEGPAVENITQVLVS